MSYLTSEVSRDEIASGGMLAEFEVLYRCQVGAVTAFFARRSRDPQTVADLTADTFFEAMRSFGSFDPTKGSGPAWLFAIARRVYARHCDRATRRREASDRDNGRRTLDGDEFEELVGESTPNARVVS